MQYTTLGRTGLVVSRLSLGTMTFGAGATSTRGFTYTIDQDQADQMVSQALDVGINLFDTADAYAEGRSTASHRNRSQRCHSGQEIQP